MGTGPARKPSVMKELEGKLRKKPSNPQGGMVDPNEPKLAAIQIPSPPEDFSDRQKLAWLEFAEIIDPMNVCTKADLKAFTILAKSWARCEELDQSLRAAGCMVNEKYDKEGNCKYTARPELAALATHEKLCLVFMTRFGLTPADRSRVGSLTSQKDAEDFAEFAD